MQNTKEIPIVLITDSNYVFATRITIRSMMRFKKPESEYRIYVIGVSLTDRDVAELKSESSSVSVICEENKYKNFCKVFTHVSTAALYKFDMANLFPQYDKVLYMDTDILVLDDLSELFETDISGKYAALTKDYRGMAMLNLHKKMNHENYYFSGNMLANLALWRKDGLYEKMIELKKNNTFNGMMDQDVFNVVFQEKVVTLPIKYNAPTMKWWGDDKTFQSFFAGEELEQITNFRNGKIIPRETVIVHYFMRSKPWISLRNDKYMRYWWTFLTPKEAVCLYTSLIVKKIKKLIGIGKK